MNFRARHCLAALIMVATVWSSPAAWSVACDAVFTNGVQSHASGGQVNLNNRVEVNGGNEVLSTASLNANNNTSCNSSTCVASGTPAASVSPAFENGTGGDGAINATGNGGQNSEPEGDYTSVNIPNDRRLNFTTPSGLYLMESVSGNDRSELRLSTGNYWVDGDFSFGNDSLIRRQGGGGVRRIFVNGNVQLGDRFSTGNLQEGELLIYATGDIAIGNDSDLVGFLYAGGNLQLNARVNLQGASSGAQATVGDDAQIDYDADSLANNDYTPFCGGGPPPAVLTGYWQMDEPEWNGTAGEVLDTSGNNLHGTATGALTDDASPALTGNPGTCGYGEFNGASDYVTVNHDPLLNGLDGLSYSAWVRADNWSGVRQVMSKSVHGGGSGRAQMGIFSEGGALKARVETTAGRYEVQTALPGTGTWVHLASVFEGDQLKLYINGAQAASDAFNTTQLVQSSDPLVIGKRVGTAEYFFAGNIDEVRVYQGALTQAQVSALASERHECLTPLCPGEDEVAAGGLVGDYYNTTDFSGGVVDTRVDGPVNFDWGSGRPGVNGAKVNQFSVQWNGFIRATETGDYRFQTDSDDGVRLYVDGQLVIERWNDHAVTTDTSGAVSLQAGQVYPIRLEFYENRGQAEIRLRWRTPSSGNYVPIPAGADAPGLSDGLYYCQTQQAAYYEINHSSTGITCEAEPVTITAYNSQGNIYSPPNGTVLTLSPQTATENWAGGNTFTFDGATSQFTRGFRKTTPGTVNLDVSDGQATEAAFADPDILFTDVGLRFYGDTSLAALPDQFAGVEDTQPVLRIIETNSDTGACEARVENDSETVNLGYECVNPTSCVAGQTFDVGTQPIAANNNGSSVNQTSLTLSFNNNGFASIPLRYSDVGQVRLHGSVQLPEEGDEPAITVTGSSSPFVVKPYTLEVASVSRSDGSANPATSGGGDGFVAAGQAFEVVVEGRNAQGNVTPNYGNENTPQAPRLDEPSLSVAYPSGGDAGLLSGTDVFSATGGNTGRFRNTAVSWNEVGTFTVIPRLQGDDYLGSGDLFETTRSGNIGRFYPQAYALTGSTVTDSCTPVLPFTYMSEPGIAVNYSLEARNLAGNRVQNYDAALGYAVAEEAYDYENAGECLPALGSCDGGARLSLAGDPQWQSGELNVNDIATFSRGSAPEPPLNQLQLAVTLTGDLDNRPLLELDINPQTAGDCSTANNCTMKALEGTLDLRYGRLKLGSAYGPEILDLPVDMATQYYNGTGWVTNEDDSCTRINRSAIDYPDGSIDVDANRDVSVGAGTSRGEYAAANIDSTTIIVGAGSVDHFFSAPGSGNIGEFDVTIDLTAYPWLTGDWDRDGSNETNVSGTYQFGSYRGHDRIIYWREVLD